MNKKVTIKPINGVLTLHQDDKPAHCPFRNPVILPPTIQGAPPQISIPSCNEQCIFFDYNLNSVTFYCTNTIFNLNQYEQQ